MPTVSVNIVTFNSSPTIEACLAGVLAQQGVDFSIYLIDNASQDDTAARAEAMGVPVHRAQVNLGYAAAHNQALNATTSDYVLTLNPDVWLDPHYLRSMVQMLESDSSLGSAAGCLLRVEQLGSTPQVVDSTGLFMGRNRRQYLRDANLPVHKLRPDPTPIFGPDGAAAFYRRAMLEDVPVMGEVFDSDFFMHKEDVDLCWRAQLRGWKSIYVPTAVAHHIRGFRPGKRRHVSPQMRFCSVRNRYLLMIKNEITVHFYRDLWAILAYDLAIFAYMIIKERHSLSALRSAWLLRRRMLEKRQHIQQQKRVGWQTLYPFFSGNHTSAPAADENTVLTGHPFLDNPIERLSS